MFYSHEILTNRKYGVATVWLVATLGYRSAFRKVDKKAISNVNVPKACEIVIQPEAPMALRLQSNLLFGVTAVYNQQCGYVLTDAQTLQNHMRTMLRSAQNGGMVDPAAGRTKPDLLLLQDDPNYLPDLAFTTLAQDFGLDALTTSSSDLSALTSPHESASSRTSISSALPGLRIPSSDSGGADAFGDLGGYEPGTDDIAQTGQLTRVRPAEEYLPDPGFEFDADFNIIDVGPSSQAGATPGMPASAGPRAASEVSERVRREHEAARMAGEQVQDDYGAGYGPFMDDDYAQLPGAEPFPVRPADGSPQQPPRISEEAEQAEDEASSDYATAPARRRRVPAPKPLPIDARPELSNTILREWKDNYLANMAELAATKLQRRLRAAAPRNAEYYLWGSGISGIGSHLGGLGMPSPLDVFHGEVLRNLVLGITPEEPTARKRSSAELAGDEAAEEEARRVRPREVDIGRDLGEDEAMFAPLGDDDLPYPEAGRDAPTPLQEDLSAMMPWNLSASARSRSSVLQRGRGLGLHSRAGSVTSLPLQQGRLTSASPLYGRGSMLQLRGSRAGSLVPGAGALPGDLGAAAGPSSVSGYQGAFDDLGGMGMDDDEELYRLPEPEDEMEQREFERFGPAAGVGTQAAQGSQWLRRTLDAEAENFLDFVDTAVRDRTGVEGENVEGASITFEELLPPTENTKVVAAQALLHVLSLGTKTLLEVQQEDDYGDIGLRVRKLRQARLSDAGGDEGPEAAATEQERADVEMSE